MIKNPHFIAELKYRSTEQGGRKTPAASGYRPQVKFDFEEMQTSGNQKFIGTELVYPGEIVIAEITVLSPQLFEGKLEIGMEFEFREGPRVIGTGKIMEVANKTLERKKAST
ncbi:hypothetical protein [uncultured Aquimarina sp.]|uniref:EF-Tu C-terminal domain-related protein n=1 Tax=uncultured Aquimarina sp. TaxID=575652 RepID=UPI00261A5639|nr:hypothetical protein [uncultured Aquimarina sp.]